MFCTQMFDVAPIVLAVLDRDLRYRAVNRAWSRASGLPAEAVVGRRGPELHLGVDPGAWDPVRRVFATGRPIVEVEASGATPVEPWDERVWLSSHYPLYDPTTGLVAVGSMVADITDERRAQARRDLVERRLRLLGRASGLLGACLSLPATLREMATLVIPEFADTCELFLADEPCPAGAEANPLVLRRALWEHAADLPHPPPGLRLPPAGAPVDVTGSQTGRAFLTRRPVLAELDDRLLHSETPGLAALYRHFRIRSAIIVPLLAARNCIGCAAFAVTAARPYDEPDVHTAMELGTRIATAIANARTFDHQRAAALTLQKALLPSDIPEVPDLDLAWRYLPGTSGAEVGGDWFDVVTLPAGRVALVIGDVMGHSLQAAAAMGQLRTTARTLARLDLPPTHVLAELDAVTHGIGILASVVYVVLNPATHTLTMVNGGHLPPALRHPDGAAELLEGPHGMMLGVAEQTFTETRHGFPAGSTLALYTDGLVESPAVDITEGSRRLLDILTEPADLSTTADRLLPMLNRQDSHDDDVTLLLARSSA